MNVARQVGRAVIFARRSNVLLLFFLCRRLCTARAKISPRSRVNSSPRPRSCCGQFARIGRLNISPRYFVAHANDEKQVSEGRPPLAVYLPRLETTPLRVPHPPSLWNFFGT